MEYIKISIAKDFSKTPGPRYKKEGDFSAEEFLENIFEPQFKFAIANHKKIEIDLDGTIGYGTSFLEEIFGGLARKYSSREVSNIISIKSDDEEYLKSDIKDYIKSEDEKDV